MCNLVPVQQDVAGAVGVQAQQCPDEAGFAAAWRTDDAKGLAGFDMDAQILEYFVMLAVAEY